MKLSGVRAIPALLLLALVLFPASLSAISVFDVIRLSQQKYSDDEIVRIIQATDSRFVLNADDATRLRKEGVTEVVIREMLSRPAREKANAPAAKSAAARPSRRPARQQAAVESPKKETPADISPPSRDPASILDEIVRLTKAGLTDETVLAYAKAHRGELPSVLSADRLHKLRESGVSETVVRYLTAIDVRASSDVAAENTASYDYGESDGRSTADYSSPAEEDDNGGSYDDGGYDAGYYGDGGASYAAYPASDYACYYGDYPFYGGVFYAYPAYFFVNRGDFFARFHRRGHDFRRHRGDAGHHRGFGRHGFPRDRQAVNGFGRGFRGRHGGIAARPGFRNRPALSRGDFFPGSRQPRGPAMGRGGPGRLVLPPRSFGQVSRTPRGGVASPGAAFRPGFSSGSHPAASVSRAPIARSGGGAPSMGRPGGVARR